MPGSVVLDTVLGLIFVFLTASLISSAAIEWLGNRLNKRGEYLLRGLRELLDIPPATPDDPLSQGTVEPAGAGGLMPRKGRRSAIQDLAVEGVELTKRLSGKVERMSPLADLVLAHPVIASLHRPAHPGRPASVRGRRAAGMHLASYVSAQAFAESLLDLLGRTTTPGQLRKRIENLPDGLPARDALLSLIRGAGEDVDRFRYAVERWYDEQMGRVSGWYKRWTQRNLLIVGAVLAVVMNINTLAVAQSLYQDEPVRHAVVAQAVSTQGCPAEAGPAREACLAEQQDVLRDLRLPVGWNLDAAQADCRAHHGETCSWQAANWAAFWWASLRQAGVDGVLLTILGWLLTAVAVSFGAPFWFDALSKLGSLRTAGRRPGENGPPASASALPPETFRSLAVAAPRGNGAAKPGKLPSDVGEAGP